MAGLSMSWQVVQCNNIIFPSSIQFNSIIYSHNTVQFHSIHVSVTKYNVYINNNNKIHKNSI